VSYGIRKNYFVLKVGLGIASVVNRSVLAYFSPNLFKGEHRIQKPTVNTLKYSAWIQSIVTIQHSK